MKKITLFLLSVVWVAHLFSQDYLSVPGSNPHLFEPDQSKISLQVDSLIYNFDTLSLPFVDDFSENHLPKSLRQVDLSLAKDTVLYKYYQAGSPNLDTSGFRIDTTFYYLIGAGGDTLNTLTNTLIILEEYDINQFPSTKKLKEVYPPYTIFDTISGGSDTLRLASQITQDSARYYILPKDTNAWYTDRKVYINEDFALNPPTIGMATFDGLNEFGLPYILDFNQTQKADFLTSVPIDLSSVSASDEVFFSFYYHPKGLSFDGPDFEDSLVLEFYNPDNNAWSVVWGTPGIENENPLGLDTFLYEQIMVEPVFHKQGFRFRFRAYAQGSGAYDHWHLDYIYLDDNRDTVKRPLRDVAYISPPPSLLKDYHAMPWWHFKSDPSTYQADSSFTRIRNLSGQNTNVFFRLAFPDTTTGSNYYFTPPPNSFLVLDSLDTLRLKYDINFDYHPDEVNGSGTFETIYTLDLRPQPNDPKQLILSNDRINAGIQLENFYAYDDGTAEVGYGVEPQLGSEGYVSYMAMRFEIPFSDTIGGAYIYFLPKNPDIRGQSIQITVWNNLNQGSILYQQPELVRPMYTENNGFVPYFFDSSVVVNQVFYIGVKAIGQRSLNIGYDLNTNNRDKMAWSFNGNNWFPPSSGILDGTLMIRPIFRKKRYGIGLNEAKLEEIPDFYIFPNPARNRVTVQTSGGEKVETIRLYNLSGQLIVQNSQSNHLEFDHLLPGVYLLKVELEGKLFQTRKLLIAK